MPQEKPFQASYESSLFASLGNYVFKGAHGQRTRKFERREKTRSRSPLYVGSLDLAQDEAFAYKARASVERNPHMKQIFLAGVVILSFSPFAARGADEASVKAYTGATALLKQI